MKILNRKAYFNYEIIEKYEFGIVLLSSEVKSLRAGSVSISEAYLNYKFPHMYIYNMFIGHYKNIEHEERANRIILLHKNECKKIIGKIQKKGYSLIPLELFWNKRGFAKLICGLCIGKKLYDKRRALKEREIKNEKSKIIKHQFR